MNQEYEYIATLSPEEKKDFRRELLLYGLLR